MSEKNTSTFNYWHFLFTELADPRTNDWLLVNSPLPTVFILIAYLYFVLNWGPKFMQNRKPFRLGKTLIVYNFFQVVLSTWLVYEYCMIWKNCSWRCQPMDYSLTFKAYREARVSHAYFLAKITELLDTVFFVLRKNDRQVTFLHVYHHTMMPLITWGCSKYYPGGHAMFIGMINSFVHIVMYTYYLLSAFGPQMQKYLWWKKYITNMQMIQFCVVFIHQTQLLYTDCNYPRWVAGLTLPNAIFFYFLFNNFYQQCYKGKSTDTKEQNGETTKLAKENGAIKSSSSSVTKSSSSSPSKKNSSANSSPKTTPSLNGTKGKQRRKQIKAN